MSSESNSSSTDEVIPWFHRFVLGTSFLSCSASFIFPLMGIFLITIGNLSESQSALAMSLAFLVSGIILPWVGRFADRGYQRRLAFGGGLAVTVGIVVAFAFGGLVPLIIGLGLFLIGSGILQMGAARILEGDVSDAIRPKMATLRAVATNAGLALSALMAFVWLQDHRWFLIVLDGITTAAFAIAVGVAPTTHHEQVEVSSSERKRLSLQETRTAWRQVLSAQLLYTLTCAPLSALPLLYHALHWDTSRLTPLTNGINCATVVAFGLIVSKSKLFKSQRARLIAMVMLNWFGLSLVGFTSSWRLVAILTPIWSMGEVLIYPIASVAVFGAFPKEQSGEVAGILTMLQRIALVLAPLYTWALLQVSPYAIGPGYGVLAVVSLTLLWEKN